MRYGSLIMGGFPGPTLPDRFASALRAGDRAGAILFKSNVEGGPSQVAALTRQLREASPDRLPLLGVDQEGGRVARLRAPVLEVPPMRTVASWGDVVLAGRIARAVGAELAALGFSIAFAPVLDVNTRADNPVIGDRAFGDEPGVCARYGVAWLRGLQDGGVLACGKHFPGHGDTSKDSHVDLPVVDQPLARLERVELEPFRAAAAAGIATMMTAHVVYPAIDPALPGTLSPRVCTDLRERIGFDGVLVSDDLEMRAIDARYTVEESAVAAIAAGCDLLLVCWSEDKQDRAAAALEREAAASPAFRARCEQAAARLARARARLRAPAVLSGRLDEVVGGAESRAVAAEIARRLAS